MAQTYLFLVFVAAALFCSINGENITNVPITTANTPFYVWKPIEDTTYHFTFTSNLRGFLIFDKYFTLLEGEEIIVYNGNDTAARYRLATYKSDTNMTQQRLTFAKGEGFTVLYKVHFDPNAPTTTTVSTTTTSTTTTTATSTTTTTPSSITTTTTPMPPQFFMFLVSAYDEPESLMNSTQISGDRNYNITLDSFSTEIKSFPGVEQYWHFYPTSNGIQLNFMLISSTALKANNSLATLTLFSGYADNANDNGTFIKTYDYLKSFDNQTHSGEYGEALTLFFNYPNNTNPEQELGYTIIISPHLSKNYTTVVPVTDSSGNTIIPTNPTIQGNSTDPTAVTGTGTVTVTSQTTTTTSTAAPIFFSLAPVFISLILQKLCQTSSN